MRTLTTLLLVLGLTTSALGCGDKGSAAAASASAAVPTAAAAPAGPRPVTNPDMDPRTVEPCVSECRGKHSGGASDPAYMPCFTACKAQKAAEINATAK